MFLLVTASGLYYQVRYTHSYASNYVHSILSAYFAERNPSCTIDDNDRSSCRSRVLNTNVFPSQCHCNYAVVYYQKGQLNLLVVFDQEKCWYLLNLISLLIVYQTYVCIDVIICCSV